MMNRRERVRTIISGVIVGVIIGIALFWINW